MSVFTKRGVDIFAPTDAAGNQRKVANGEAQTWSTEVERSISASIETSLSFQGGWDASDGSFPGSGAADRGHAWRVTTAGTVDSQTFRVGDLVIALVSNASTSTYSGNWIRVAAALDPVVRGTDSGAGTANAIEITTPRPISQDGGQIISFSAFEANTGSPVSLRITDSTGAEVGPLTIKTASGNDPATGGIAEDAGVSGQIDGSEFRLLSDQTSAAIQAAAEAAQTAAETAQAEAEDARDAAEGYAEDAAIAADQWAYSSRSSVTSITVPAVVTAIMLLGYSAAGDGGGGLYQRVGSEPSHAAKVQDDDGAWFELVPDKGVLTPLQVAAEGDGSPEGDGTGTDDHTALSNTHAAASALNAAKVHLAGLAYRCDEHLDWPAGIALEGPGTLDFYNEDGGSGGVIRCTGSEGAAATLSANATDAKEIRVPEAFATTLSPFRYLKIRSDELWTTQATPTAGEFAKVHSIEASGTNRDVELFSYLHQRYQTSDNAEAALVDFHVGARFRDVTILGNRKNLGDSSIQRGIVCTFARNVRVTDCTVAHIGRRGLVFDNCYDFRATGNHVAHCGTENGSSGYSVSVNDGSMWGEISDNTLEDARHATHIGGTDGPVRHVKFNYNNCIGIKSAGMDSHAPSEHCEWIGNNIDIEGQEGTGDGIIVQGRSFIIALNTIRGNLSGRVGIRSQMYTAAIGYNAASDGIITGNRIECDCDRAIDALFEGDQIGSIIVTNNVHKAPILKVGASDVAFRVAAIDVAGEGATISGNISNTGSSGGITVQTSGASLEYVIISANQHYSSGADASGQRAIYLNGDGSNGLRYNAITGNVARMGGGSSGGIIGSDDQTTLVDGNIVASVGTAISVNGTVGDNIS